MTGHNPPYFARIISLKTNPEDLDTLLTIYRTSSMPMVAGLPGLVLVAGVASRRTGQASSITVWETAEDRERGGINAESADNLSLYAPLMVGSYVRDAYDVPVCHLRLGSTRGFGVLLGRTMTEDIEPPHWDAATKALQQMARSLSTAEADGYGVMVFESRALSRAVLIELATSRGVLEAQAPATRAHRSAARAARHLRRPATTEAFDVIDLA